MKSKHIFIEQLARPCITRQRGKEAFSKLQEYLMETPVEIDFGNCETVSLSFLDELIMQIHQFSELNKVIFQTSNSLIEDKLARISGFRNMIVFSQTKNKVVYEVTPQLPVSGKATFVSDKVLL